MLFALLLIQDAPPPDREPDCAAPRRDEIIVCRNRDDERFRLRPLPDKYVRSDRAEVNVAGGKAAVEAEQGRYDPRIMVRFRLPF